jgi:LCP family protein required for cell wall assembly
VIDDPPRELARAATSAGRSRAWRRAKWTVVAVAATLCALVLAGGVDLVVLEHRLRHVAVRFPDGGSGSTWLVVGSDARRGAGPRRAGQRADVILLVHTGAPHASVISVPRDLLLWSQDGGVERAALAFNDGPQRLVDGLCRTLGVPVTHLAIVTMHGFEDIVDAVGGLSVRIPAPVRDRRAGLELDRSGVTHLSGAQALALVRSRHPQHLVNGSWTRVGEHAGAVTRSRTAAALFAAIRSRARSARRNPISLQRVLWTATGAITLDRGAGLTDLLGLVNGSGRLTALPAARLPRTIAVLADAATRRVLDAAGYPSSCTPAG